eukprot:6191708-Pleurochrysis_carterae.AAC.2
MLVPERRMLKWLLVPQVWMPQRPRQAMRHIGTYCLLAQRCFDYIGMCTHDYVTIREVILLHIRVPILLMQLAAVASATMSTPIDLVSPPPTGNLKELLYFGHVPSTWPQKWYSVARRTPERRMMERQRCVAKLNSGR